MMTARFPEERLAVFTLTERPDLRAQLFSAEIQSGLPEFMRHDRTAALYYSDGNLDRYLDFAFAGVDRERPDRVIARAFSVPFAFRDGSPARDELPDDGWGRVIRWAHQDWRKGRMPIAVSVLDINVLAHHPGADLPSLMLGAMPRS